MNDSTPSLSNLITGHPISYTGQQISNAIEHHCNALRANINKVILHNNRLSNLSLVKNQALNSLTSGEYRRLFDHQKTLRNDPQAQDQCRQIIKSIEAKYTTPPHIVELSKEMKYLKTQFEFLTECNNNTLAALEKKLTTTLKEKRKLQGHDKDIFSPSTDKIAELYCDVKYQTQIRNLQPIQKTNSL